MDDKSLIKRYRSEIDALKQKLAVAMDTEEKLKQFDELQTEKQRV
jgi:hypothetical protein